MIYKNAAIYLASSIINKMVPFLFIPILTRILSPDEFGILSIYQVSITFGIALCGFCLNMNVARNYARLEKAEFARLNAAVIVILLCATIAVLIFIASVVAPAGELLGLSSGWWLTIPVVAFFSMLLIIALTVFRIAEQPFIYAIFEISTATVSVALTCLFIFILDYGWEGRAFALFFTPVIVGSAVIHFLYKQGDLAIFTSKAHIQNAFWFSLPLLPHALSSAVMGVSDRFILAEFQGLSDVGLYSVGYSFGMVVFLLTDAIAKAWSPYVLNGLAKDRDKLLRDAPLQIVKIGSGLFFAVCLYVLAIKMLLPLLVGVEYLAAERYIAIVAYAYFFFGLYQLGFPFLVAVGASSKIGIASVASAICNVLLTYFLVVELGAIGAAFATLITYLVLALIFGALVKRVWSESA